MTHSEKRKRTLCKLEASLEEAIRHYNLCLKYGENGLHAMVLLRKAEERVDRHMTKMPEFN